jgi:late competence protein required for DNA uptake (superfamily II DNA/RNA helicase)
MQLLKFLLLISDQEDRQWSIREFREGRKDVLVATDVASKGLDFPNIQHVINYDMPPDIENYGECASHHGFACMQSYFY